MTSLIRRPAPEAPVAFGPIAFIPGNKAGRYPYCHSLVITGAETWVVDPGSHKEYLRRLARERRVTRVLCSHFHEDHLKYHHLFPEAVFYVPRVELEAFTSLTAVYRLAGVADPSFQAYLAETLARDFHFPVRAPLVPYHPGERLVNGDVVLEIIPAPGHTPGHSCFFFPGQDLLFLADVDLTPFGPWYGDAASDLADFAETLERLADFPARIFLTSHDQGIFTAAEAGIALAEFRQVIRDREARLLKVLETPHTLAELVKRRLIYGRSREPAFIYDHMEAQMLAKHLASLERDGRAERAGESFRSR